MLCDDIRYLTERALWETENLIACIPDTLWDRRYDELPLWKYVYHMLFSMDRWFINPFDSDYLPPAFHTDDLPDLNAVPEEGKTVSREQISGYFDSIRKKITDYTAMLTDEMLSVHPPCCDMTRMCLILGQYRHWHRHMGIVYGFLIRDMGKWPYVLNMRGAYPETPMPNFYDDGV